MRPDKRRAAEPSENLRESPPAMILSLTKRPLIKKYCASRVVRRSRGAEIKPETLAINSRPPRDGQKTVNQIRAENLISAFAQIFGWRKPQNFAPVIGQSKSDFGMSERVMRDDRSQMIIFRRFRTHKFAPRRSVKKQISDGNRRSRRTCRVFDIN